jgi:hypothetical protein
VLVPLDSRVVACFEVESTECRAVEDPEPAAPVLDAYGQVGTPLVERVPVQKAGDALVVADAADERRGARGAQRAYELVGRRDVGRPTGILEPRSGAAPTCTPVSSLRRDVRSLLTT